MNQYPHGKLARLSFTLTFTISLIIVFFFWASGKFQMVVIVRFLGSLIFFFLTSWINIFLFRIKHKYQLSKVKKVGILLASYIGSFFAWTISWVVSQFLAHLILHNSDLHKLTAYSVVLLSVFCSNTFVLVMQRLVISHYNETRKEIENLSLKANLADASNLLLRQQLQPHFLFNALTMVKSLYKYDAKQGEEYLVHLASFLRESLVNKTSHTVLVQEELAFCNHYIKMQEIRFEEAVHFHIDVSEHTRKNKYLPYFSLQPLIENAFKHNDFTDEKPLKIEILEDKNFIVVGNTLRARHHVPESTGNGLSNLSERYKLLNEEPIQIHSGSEKFEVKLKLLEQ